MSQPTELPIHPSIGPLYDAGYLAAKAHYEPLLASRDQRISALQEREREAEKLLQAMEFAGWSWTMNSGRCPICQADKYPHRKHDVDCELAGWLDAAHKEGEE